MNTVNPLVSVVVITYNQENTIAQTLDSILVQDIDFSKEIIVGEDCSKDTTREICVKYQEKYPDIIHLILHEHNQGLLKNYQSVLKACKGKYIAQCAGDDYWHDLNKLKLQVDFLEANPDYGLIHSDVSVLISKTGEIKTSLRTNVTIGNVYKPLLLNGNHIFAPTVMFRRGLLQYVNIDNFIQNGFLMEDYPMWLEFSNHTKFHWINKSLATYRRNDNSASHFSDYSKTVNFNENVFHIRKYYHSFYPDDIKRAELDIFCNTRCLALAIKYDQYTDVKKYAKCVDARHFKQRIKRILLSNYYLYKIYKKMIYKNIELL